MPNEPRPLPAPGTLHKCHSGQLATVHCAVNDVVHVRVMADRHDVGFIYQTTVAGFWELVYGPDLAPAPEPAPEPYTYIFRNGYTGEVRSATVDCFKKALKKFHFRKGWHLTNPRPAQG